MPGSAGLGRLEDGAVHDTRLRRRDVVAGVGFDDVGVGPVGHEQLGIAWSSSATISHFGTDTGGLTVVGSASAAAVIGRWVTAATAIWLLDSPPA
jgi:hypothetical protein